MKLDITYQSEYSRGELLLRSFFGWIYIGIPHGIALAILGWVAEILWVVTFFAILFTGKYPKSLWDFIAKVMAWSMRVNVSFWHLVDGYPEFGLEMNGAKVKVEIPYAEEFPRGELLLRVLFGWLYVGIPHMFVLFFRFIGAFVLMFLAWWVVLFTGKYPENWHRFIVETYRWQLRVSLWYMFMEKDYPPFHGREV